MVLGKGQRNEKKPYSRRNDFWECLQSKKLEVKFRQQHLIDEFIVDFVCLEKKLIIEVDGHIHNVQLEADAREPWF